MDIFLKTCFLLAQLGLALFQQTMEIEFYVEHYDNTKKIVEELYGEESEWMLNLLALEV